ncbi:MAG: lipid-transfer protein [Spirochaetaceae bacterium]|nr:lipid-transfer protein [Spirochaetaceae bacterium]HPG26730.1 lipid-transfer protein [Myxococcota bacterium]
MPASLVDQAAIVGIGQTEFSKESGRSELQLAAEASLAAIRDAGLTPADIDGLITFTLDTSDELLLMRALGLPEIRFWSRTPHGGAGSTTTILHAASAVASGAAKHVLVWRAFNERSGHRFGQPNAAAPPLGWNWYLPFGLDTPAKIYSLTFQRYMDAYGLTNEDFGRYTVVARKHAATNPNAWFYERPITLADHQASRWIVEPILRLLDCCQESDGGVALVISTAERARDLPQPLVRLRHVVDSHLMGGHVMFNYYLEDHSRFEECHSAAARLYGESGLTASDMDAAMLYENFSPVVFMQLEGFGFCGPGEARDFVRDGHIELGGSLPVNTHGGLLGEAYIHGMNNILEGVRQIRGQAVNQVAGARHVLVGGGRGAMILAGD